MRRARFYLLGFAALAVCDTSTQVAFKLASLRSGEFSFTRAWFGASAHSPWTYVAVAGYLGAFVMWMTLLEHAPVGTTFAISNVDLVMVLLISVPLFGERLSAMQLAGAACIIAGIVVIGRAAEREERAVEGSVAGAPLANPRAPSPESRADGPAR